MPDAARNHFCCERGYQRRDLAFIPSRQLVIRPPDEKVRLDAEEKRASIAELVVDAVHLWADAVRARRDVDPLERLEAVQTVINDHDGPLG